MSNTAEIAIAYGVVASGASASSHDGAADWETLMAAVQEGDSRAYERLLREVRPFLRTIAQRKLGNSSDAEDAVQDTLLSIHRLRHIFDPRRPLRPWMAEICRRRCVDQLRSRGRSARRHVQFGTLTGSLAAPKASEAPSWPLEANELHAAVAQLPRSQREALEFVKLGEMTLAEASAVSGRPVGAIKVATHRAIRALRLQFNAAPA